MRAARELVERAAHGTSEHTYGVNTGFGRFVSRSIPEELTAELQLRLLRSHACGVGDPYPDEIVRAAMLLRANALAKGYSGARVETVELLLALPRTAASLPVVPSRGSVGASGDLAPLAHLALPLVGEGEAWVDGERLPGVEALARAGLEPVRLEAKEGLSLVNGTQFMAAFARARARAGAAARARGRRRLRAVARGAAGLAHVVPAADPRAPAAARPERLRPRTSCALLDGLGDHRGAPLVRQGAGRVLAALRAAGARRLRATCSTTSTTRSSVELNAATDNPLVLVDDDVLVSNGNFHGQPLAFALDALAMAVAELASISERRRRAARQPEPVRGLPAFLTADGGLNSGFMIPQYVAASLVSREQGALPPGERRLDPDERRPGGSRLDGERRRAEGVAGARELASARWRSSCSPARRRSSSSRRSSRAPACAPRGRRCASCRRGCATTGRSPPTSRRWRRRSATARSLAAVEAEAGELR